MIRIFNHDREKPKTNYDIIASCISNRGNVRENNEDNLYFDGRYLEQNHDGLSRTVTIQSLTEHAAVFAVFDGMGGECCGEVASYLAASEFHRCVLEEASRMRPEAFLTAACEQMNERICSEAENRGARGMGTTAAILLFQKNLVYACNLGDSPIFRVRDGVLSPVYEEHTNRLFLQEQGITKRKPALTQCLGIPRDEMIIQPYLVVNEMAEGDQYLICSDGLTDMVTQDEIRDILMEEISSEECINKLLDQVWERGARDNITIILCRVA